MKRLLFFVMLAASIALSMSVVLFVPGFWAINTTGEAGGASAVSQSGFSKVWDFVSGGFLENYNWAWSPEHVLLYATILFLAICLATLVVLAFILILNFGFLNRSERFYRNALWFWFATMLLSGAYLWVVVDAMGADGAVWSLRAFPVWFYIPIVSGTVMAALSGIFKQSELNS